MEARRCGCRSEIGLILPVNILWGFSSPGLPDKKFFFVLAFSSAGCSRPRASNIWLEWRHCPRHEIANLQDLFLLSILPLARGEYSNFTSCSSPPLHLHFQIFPCFP